MSTELFDEQEDLALAGEADDRRRSARGGVGRVRGSGDTQAPLPTSGTWSRCASGEHELCLYRLRVNASWATAGAEPPDPFAEPTEIETCSCPCEHVGRAKTVDGNST